MLLSYTGTQLLPSSAAFNSTSTKGTSNEPHTCGLRSLAPFCSIVACTACLCLQRGNGSRDPSTALSLQKSQQKQAPSPTGLPPLSDVHSWYQRVLRSSFSTSRLIRPHTAGLSCSVTQLRCPLAACRALLQPFQAPPSLLCLHNKPHTRMRSLLSRVYNRKAPFVSPRLLAAQM